MYVLHLHTMPFPPLKVGGSSGGVVYYAGPSEDKLAKASQDGRVVLAVIVEWKK